MAALKQPVHIQQSVEDFSKKWGNSKEDFKDDLKAFIMKVVSNNEKKDNFDLSEIMKKLNDIQEENREIKELLNNKPAPPVAIVKKSNLGKFASTAAKKLADENDLGEDDIEGSGKNGKILMKDVKKLIEPVKESKKSKESKKVKDKHPCGGISKSSGNACKMSGKTKGEDSVWYCNRHIVDFQEKQDEIEEEDEIESIADGDIEFKITGDFEQEEDENEENENEEIGESDGEQDEDDDIGESEEDEQESEEDEE
jgi:hypothetical protein